MERFTGLNVSVNFGIHRVMKQRQPVVFLVHVSTGIQRTPKRFKVLHFHSAMRWRYTGHLVPLSFNRALSRLSQNGLIEVSRHKVAVLAPELLELRAHG